MFKVHIKSKNSLDLLYSGTNDYPVLIGYILTKWQLTKSEKLYASNPSSHKI